MMLLMEISYTFVEKLYRMQQSKKTFLDANVTIAH